MNPITRRRFLKSSGTLTATAMLFGPGRKSAIAIGPQSPGSGSGKPKAAIAWEVTIPAGTQTSANVGPMPGKTLQETLTLARAGNQAAINHILTPLQSKLTGASLYGLGTNEKVTEKKETPFSISGYTYSPAVVVYTASMNIPAGSTTILVKGTIPAEIKVTKKADLVPNP